MPPASSIALRDAQKVSRLGAGCPIIEMLVADLLRPILKKIKFGNYIGSP